MLVFNAEAFVYNEVTEVKHFLHFLTRFVLVMGFMALCLELNLGDPFISKSCLKDWLIFVIFR